MSVMNIAIVDVAAESGGALSVLTDFLKYVESSQAANTHNWFVFTSFNLNSGCPSITNIVCPEVKKSWFHRLKWENYTAKKLFEQYKIDRVVSLQNTGFISLGIPQIVYFHNVLLLEDKGKYSLFKKSEMKYAVYTRFIAPYTLRTLNKVQTVIVQTNVTKKKLATRIDCSNIVVIRPNVNLPIETELYKNDIKGIFYPAAAVPFKQFEELVECVSSHQDWFKENSYEVVITIKGNENSYAAYIAEKARNVSCIKLTGYLKREEVLELYKNYALFINSEMESFPLPLVEGQYYGCPIIAADYDYAAEVLERVETATLFPKHDIEAMFQAIQSTSSKKNEGPNPRVIQHNTWEDVVKLITE